MKESSFGCVVELVGKRGKSLGIIDHCCESQVIHDANQTCVSSVIVPGF